MQKNTKTAAKQTKTQHKTKQQFFFRRTPSWLSPGRSTCFIACCKIGLID
jgi:hypothetical protein